MRFMVARITLGAMAVLLLLLGCGVSLDDSPREISSDSLPEELRPGLLPTPTPRPASNDGPGQEQIHMLKDDRLITVERQIVDTPERLMEILLRNTFPEEAAEGIQSAIFRGTSVQSVAVNDLLALATVDLAEGSLDPRNSEQRYAFAQIVFTLTSLAGIEQVQFVQSYPDDPERATIDLAVQTDSGTLLAGARVTRENFARLTPLTPALPGFDLPVATPTPTPDPNAPPTFQRSIWMLDETNRLTRVTRTIEGTKEALLRSLLEGPLPVERNVGFRSAIPPVALANSLLIDELDVLETDELGVESVSTVNLARLDLSDASLPPDSDGDELLYAAAQIVFTLTEAEEIDKIVFSVDGVPLAIRSDQTLDPNTQNAVDRTDYQSVLDRALEPGALLNPTPGPTPGPTP